MRSTTLRLRTVLEFSLEGSEDKAASRTFGKWKKAANKLRTVLQPVRDRDVYLARLKSLEKPSGKQTEGQLTARALKEAEKLERRLKRKRKAGAKELADKVEVRGKKLKRLGKKLEAAMKPMAPVRAEEAGEAAAKIFAGLAGEHANLNSSNMHDYRKGLKRALYLAEISSPADTGTGKLTAALKKIHEAAGEWHDWQMLALEAAKVLGKSKHKDGLVPVLEAMAEKALKNAIELCMSTAAELLPEAEDDSGLPPRKPVASVRSAQAEDEEVLTSSSG